MTIERIPEPELQFQSGANTYCKTGLLANGPYDASKDSHSSRLLVGIIGTKELIERTKEWIKLCNNSIESKPHGVKEAINKNLFPDFPGSEIAFNSRIIVQDSYNQVISLSDLTHLDWQNNVKFTDDLLSIFKGKIRLVLDTNEIGPSVFLCVLTDQMYEICHVVGDYHRKLKKRKKIDPNQLNLFQDLDTFSEKDFSQGEDEPFYRNFRSALKKLAMNPEISVPIQILREHTINPHDETTQNAATKAWNFCTGLYYKSGRHPWILKDIDRDTCYLGVSFYHKKDYYNDDVYTSMAHLFSNDFEDIILKGKKVDFDDILGSPYLDYDKGFALLEEVLQTYEDLRKRKPKRMVVHKTSAFNDGERRAFAEVFENAGIIYDLISLRKSSLRLIRFGEMPVPRGTNFLLDKTTYFLYTKGFVPELKTYPGVHVPAPFQVVKSRGDSSYKEIGREILALTKLNWNTADFCCGLPITIGFARNVGQVLREFNEDDSYEPKKSYRFYM